MSASAITSSDPRTRVERLLGRALGALCVALFAVMVLIVVWQVIARQILHDSPAWTGPAAQYSFVWLIFAGATWMFAEREHVAIDFCTKLLRIDHTRTVAVVGHLMTFAFAALLLLWGGGRAVTITWTQEIPGLPVSMGMMSLALPVSGALICLVSLRHAVAAARGIGGGVIDRRTGPSTSTMQEVA
ncbi:TRAP transporter small permease [Nesterenkonia halophila]|uniref:TRAP transporter small permease n=1 Tax=Nesterenkonia halophila TaxID=302044 RepID=UPI001478FEDE|nr:TRAP transporter small permease [Nesterenkonia halophila]